MTGKIITYSGTARHKVLEGVVKATNAISVTLGPSGNCVAIDNGMMGVEITRDGATVAKSIQFSDPHHNMGATLVKRAASRTEEQAGDATSTTSVLIRSMCTLGNDQVSRGVNANELKSGMLKAQKYVTEYIKSKSIKVDGDLEKIRRVATISANNDPEVGNLIASGFEKVGLEGGILTADLSSGLDTVIDVTTGMKLDRGWASPHYVTTPEDGKCSMDTPYILVVGEKLSSVNQIVNPLKAVSETGRPLLIVCDDIDEVVNSTLVLNVLRGALRCCVVKGIDFGDGRKNIMQDLATAVGATYFCPENGTSVTDASLHDFGTANKVVVSRDSCVIYEGAGDVQEIKERVEVLKSRMSDPLLSEYDKMKFSKRIAGLSGGIGIIKAGGASEAEKLNRKQTIEDAILASTSAISEGCVPGGGWLLLKAAHEAEKDKAFWKGLSDNEKKGANIVFSSLPSVLETIVENAGDSKDLVVNTVKQFFGSKNKDGWGYDAKTRKYVDLLEAGILDSTKALRVSVENAVSTSSMVLLIDCTLIEEPDEKEGNDTGTPPIPGM